jgi:antitoxin PrlF
MSKRQVRGVARVSNRGQITIPKEVRECLGIEPNDRVEFVVREEGTMTARRLLGVKELKGILPATGLDPDEAIRLAKEEHYARKYGVNK